MMTCRMQCHQLWLTRHRNGEPYTGVLAVGMIFEWEPDQPVAAETCEIVEIKNNGEELMIKTKGNRNRLPTDLHWNDESRFREAAVPSLIRFLPTGYA